MCSKLWWSIFKGKENEVSAIFRLVCHVWREAHDRLVTDLEPNASPQDTRTWRKFGGVKRLQFRNTILVVNDDCVRALTLLVSLNSLSLGSGRSGIRDYKRIVRSVTDEGMKALSSLTTLTYLDINNCIMVTINGLRALPPLTALTVVCSCGWGFVYCVFRLLFVSPSL